MAIRGDTRGQTQLLLMWNHALRGKIMFKKYITFECMTAIMNNLSKSPYCRYLDVAYFNAEQGLKSKSEEESASLFRSAG